MPIPRFLSARTVAERLSVSVGAVHRMIREGRIAAIRPLPRMLRVREDDVDRILIGVTRGARSLSVYFIQCDAGGPIKIGVATAPSSRLAMLQVANPHQLRLLGTIATDCAYALEDMLHGRYHAHRIRGEWFVPTPELLDFIKRAADA